MYIAQYKLHMSTINEWGAMLTCTRHLTLASLTHNHSLPITCMHHLIHSAASIILHTFKDGNNSSNWNSRGQWANNLSVNYWLKIWSIFTHIQIQWHDFMLYYTFGLHIINFSLLLENSSIHFSHFLTISSSVSSTVIYMWTISHISTGPWQHNYLGLTLLCPRYWACASPY